MSLSLERITSAARAARPGRTIATAIGGVFYGAGWVLCKSLYAAWFGLVWAGTAARLGWQDAKPR